MSDSERIEYVLDIDQLIFDLNCKAKVDGLRALADLVGVSASTLSRFGHKNRNPDMQTFLQICAYLDKPPGNYFRRVVWKREINEDSHD